MLIDATSLPKLCYIFKALYTAVKTMFYLAYSHRHRRIEPAPGCVSSFRASVSCCTAVFTSSKPRELAAYLASFCASDTADSDGWNPGVA